jgi:hypothetical protein
METTSEEDGPCRPRHRWNSLKHPSTQTPYREGEAGYRHRSMLACGTDFRDASFPSHSLRGSAGRKPDQLAFFLTQATNSPLL